MLRWERIVEIPLDSEVYPWSGCVAQIDALSPSWTNRYYSEKILGSIRERKKYLFSGLASPQVAEKRWEVIIIAQKVAIIIPALNEEAALRRLLAELPRNFAQWIIVVDNGSSDATAAVARDAGALVASEPARGYGLACLKGFKTACSQGAELVIFMDGDGSDDPADLPMMLAPVSEGRADLVIGSRVSKRAERGAVPPQARLGNWLVSWMISILYGVQLHDIGSFRVIRCSMLDALQMGEKTFGWPVEMLVKAARAQYRILELPIHYRHRSHGRSKVAGTFVGSIKAAYSMVHTTLRYAGARRTYV